MLKRWSLANFKSFGERIDLEMRPITILTGANSSGKSTIIQSILLIKQTLESKLEEQQLVLNGPYAKLGSFASVRHNGGLRRNVQIGWTIESRPAPGGHRTSNASRPMRLPGIMRRKATEVSCDVGFRAPARLASKDLVAPAPTVAWLSLGVELRRKKNRLNHPVLSLYLRQSRQSVDEQLEKLNVKALPAWADSLRFRVSRLTGLLLQESAAGANEQVKPVGILLRHFMPFSVIGIADRNLRDGYRWVGMMSRSASERSDNAGVFEKTERIPDELCSSLKVLAGDADLMQIPGWAVLNDVRDLLEAPKAPSVEEWLRFVGSLPHERAAQLARILRYLEEYLGKSITRGRGAALALQPLNPSFLSDIRGISEAMESFFSTEIHYIGPLREEPQVVYSSEQALQANDVGSRGEHTAALLHYRRHQRIAYVTPEAVEQGVSCEPVEGTLEAAVGAWLAYLGVAESFETADRGQLGHEMRIRTTGSAKYHDLTNVGFGVSQVVPVIVGALLAQPNSVLILEQPELHLHPRVQSRLGDFLISLSYLQKQVICESHSRHLIDRIRRRVAEAEASALRDSAAVYFLTTREGQTVVRPMCINEFGAYAEWPDGFFDESEQESDLIVRAAGRKYRSSNGGSR